MTPGSKIDGYPYTNGYGKINAAFAYGGPSLARQTVEQLTGIHIDHLAIIDWAGFKDLTTALGGIRVYIPETFYDDSQRITWEKGWHDFEGQEALAYVRTRHGLENGDFDRIERQQNFLRATMGKLLSGGTTRNPIKLRQGRRRDHPLPHRRRHVEQRRDPRPRAVDAQHPHRRRRRS